MTLPLSINPQPDETTCGPTCLHTIYMYYGDPISLDEVIVGIQQLEEGGTLGALLAAHALDRGYDATIYSYHLRVFDPSWFTLNMDALINKLELQLQFKGDKKLKIATEAYIRFLKLGGKLRFEDLNSAIIHRHLKKGHPVIGGLSATYLYRSPREYGPGLEYDDIRGEPSGHFVVLHGYDRKTRMLSIADPVRHNPLAEGQLYQMKIDRVINAILLGNVTYDANLIVITPKN